MLTIQQHTSFGVGDRVTVSDGTKQPPAHHNKKLRRWQGRNFTGVVQEVEKPRDYQPKGGLVLKDDSLKDQSWITFQIHFQLGGTVSFEITDRAKDRMYRLIEDPGHGWLEVPLDEIDALELKHLISGCSYVDADGKFAFLEEDGDLGVFAKAKGWNIGEAHAHWTVDRDNFRSIRNMAPFPVTTYYSFEKQNEYVYGKRAATS